MGEASHRYRVGCDIGGTFTDFVVLDETTGEIFVDKRLTTPADPSIGMLAGLAALEESHPDYVARTRRVAHATTLVANAVIERKGARTALLCTRGFRDVLELRRHVRVTTYELWTDPPEPLVPRFLRLPVGERTYSDGTVLTPVEASEIKAIAKVLKGEGVASVAIAFLHSFVNPLNEQAAAQLLAESAPALEITTSASVLPQIKEYERTSTAVINAYVKPLTRRYLGQLQHGLGEADFTAPLHIMLSNGGMASAETAAALPIRLIESGPVAGAIVGQHYAELLGLDDVLSFDMGGTTAKACLIRASALPITDELEVARSKRFTKSSGFPVAVPTVDMIEIGAGGGSIATVNALGLVQVGPESAGADPGPICYALGGRDPTVTDADLVLGYLNADYFAGGSMALDTEGALTAIGEQLGEPLGRDRIAAAWSVHDVVNETMAAAVRMHVTEQGGDPARATIIAFGGAGPVHVFNLARKLGVRQMLVPLRPGVLSALGLLIAPPAYDIVRTHKVPLAQADADLIGGHLREMTDDIHQTLQEVEAEGEVALAYALDIGYIGQGYQVAVALDGSDVAALDPQSLWDRFAEIYRAKYGYFYDDVPIEIVNLRASGRIPGGQHRLRPLEMGSGSVEDARTGERPAYSPAAGEMIACAVYRRERLGPGAAFTGPAIIEEPSATTIVDTRARVQVDAYGSLLIELD